MTLRARSLLERMDDEDDSHRLRGDPDPATVVASVVSCLRLILGTRLGNAPAQPQLGLPAVQDIALGFPASVKLTQRLIRERLEQFEPRLVHPTVTWVQSEGSMLHIDFRISARLRGLEDIGAISLTTRIDQSCTVAANG